jgi:hypothetical protein
MFDPGEFFAGRAGLWVHGASSRRVCNDATP